MVFGLALAFFAPVQGIHAPNFFVHQGQGYVLTPSQAIPVRGDVERWSWSPSGRWLLVRSRVESTMSRYVEVRTVWDTHHQASVEIAELRGSDNIDHIWDPFDRCLLGWTDTERGIFLRRWEYGTWKESVVMTSRPGVVSYGWAASGHLCLIEVNANLARIYDTATRTISQHKFPRDYQTETDQMTDPDLLMLTNSNNRHFGLLYSLSTKQFMKINLADTPYKPGSADDLFLVRRVPSGEMALVENLDSPPLALVGLNETYWYSPLSPTAEHLVRLSKGMLFVHAIVPIPRPWAEALGDATVGDIAKE